MVATKEREGAGGRPAVGARGTSNGRSRWRESGLSKTGLQKGFGKGRHTAEGLIRCGCKGRGGTAHAAGRARGRVEVEAAGWHRETRSQQGKGTWAGKTRRGERRAHSPGQKSGSGLRGRGVGKYGALASYIEGAQAGGYAPKPGGHNISRPHGLLGDRRAVHSFAKKQNTASGQLALIIRLVDQPCG